MAVVDPQNQLPEDPRLPVHDDPLSEFAPERSPRRERLLQVAWEPPRPSERLIEFEPDWRGPGESLTERAFPAAAPSYSLGPPRESKGRWLVGAIMLGVGLVAGFAGGVGVATRSGGDQNEAVRTLAQPPPPPQPVAAQPIDDPTTSVASATNDQTPPAEANAARPAADPLVTSPRAITAPSASSKPMDAIPSTMTALYVQSSPAGANVYLDDRLVSTTPFQLSDMVPGRYTVRIDMQGYRTWSTPVSVQQGARATISAVLVR